MASIFIRTFGCAHNQADSEMMAGQLEAAGHRIVEKRDQADLIIINSCTVKDPSQQRFLFELGRDAQREPVVVAGCVPQADPDNEHFSMHSIVGVKQIHKVVDVVERTLTGEVVKECKKTPTNPPLVVPVHRRNPLVEIIPINSGCLGKCTFCKTKHARGHLTSYQPEDILKKAKRGLAAGVKELWLTSEDLGAYGRDIDKNIITLAKEILELPGDFKLRLGMANPPLLKEHAHDLIEVLKHPKCYQFLHLPVQSGSNTILKAMRREYTVEEFEGLVNTIVSGVPNVTIATDVIVGYPGETDDDHRATMRLLAKHRFPVLNISKFYARPGTPAAKLKPLPTKIVKARSEEVAALFAAYNRNVELLGQELNILFTERGRGKHVNTIIGHTPNYREVVLPKGTVKLGSGARVAITEAKKYYVTGDVVSRQ